VATSVQEKRGIPRDHIGITKEQEIDHFIALANEARRDYESFAREYRELAALESELEADRHTLRERIKVDMMAENPSLSATSAEKLVHSAPDYLSHLREQRETVRQKDDARTRMVSAVLRCKTAIAALKALGGLI
jgi:hypothetical protein